MTDAVETMAWKGETPWHGLGVKVTDNLTPAQMLKVASLNWTVSKRKMFYENGDGKYHPATGDFALVRDSDNSHLTTVGATYKPVQNADAFDFFKKFIEAGHMAMETAGSLWSGRYVWALARVGKDFKLEGKDEVRTYLLLASPHVHGKAMVIQFTTVRVVCWNTLNMALGSGLKGDGTGFRMPHSTIFGEYTKSRAEIALGLAKEQADEFKAAATLLAKKKAKPDDTFEFFCQILKYDPKKANKKKDGEVKVPRMLPKFQKALEFAPGHNLNQGTWWSNLNAVTYVVDHESGRADRSVALKNAWLGHLAGVKRKALDLALQYAK